MAKASGATKKKLHSAKIYQTKPQTKWKLLTTNTNAITEIITGDNPKASTKINTPKEKSLRLQIHIPITKINPEPNTEVEYILITLVKLEPSQSKINCAQSTTE